MRLFFYGLSTGLQAATLAFISGTYEALFDTFRVTPPDAISWAFKISVLLMFAGPFFFWLVLPLMRSSAGSSVLRRILRT
jgi:hypothetical protein